MKRELLNAYFERDLSADEEAHLAELLKESPEEALRFSGLAAEEYRASGYPSPKPRARGRWLKRGLGLAAFLGGSLWLWSLLQAPAQTEAHRVSESAAQDRAAPEPVRPAAPADLSASQSAAEAAPTLDVQVLESGRFKLTVDLAARHQVLLQLSDAGGRVLRPFYSGSMDAGRWSFVWDGSLADGSRAQPGQPYQAELKVNGRSVKRWLQLERKQLDGINSGDPRQ